RWTSIVQSSDGTTHLSAGSWNDAYTDSSDGILYYASKPAGGSWTVTNFDQYFTSAHTSISLLPDRNPQIAPRRYMQNAVVGTGSGVYYTYKDQSENWHHVLLSPNDDFNFYNSISTMVDHWGNPMVGYYLSGPIGQKLFIHAPVDSDLDLLPDV